MRKSFEEFIKKIHDSATKYLLTNYNPTEFQNNNVKSSLETYNSVNKLENNEEDSNNRLYDYYCNSLKKYLKKSKDELMLVQNEQLIDAFLKINNTVKIYIWSLMKVNTSLVVK